MSTYSAKQLRRDVRRLRFLRVLLVMLLVLAAAVLVRVPLFSLFTDDADAAHASAKSSETAPPPVPKSRGQSTALDYSAALEVERDAQAVDEELHSEKAIGGDEGDPSSGATPPVDCRCVISPPVTVDPADSDSQPITTVTTNNKETTRSIGDANHSPVVVVEPATAHPPSTSTTGLLLHNPKRNRVPVNYVVAGVSYSLAPGEWHELPSKSALEVVFDGGSDFGERRLQIRSGVFVFRVSLDRGWELLKP